MIYRYEKNPTPPLFNEEKGAKAIYEAVTYVLRNDDTLKGLVKYTNKNPNIRRGYQTAGDWQTLISYYLQPENVMTEIDDIRPGSAGIRQAPLIFQLYNRDGDLLLYDISERIIQLLHEADLTKEGHVHVYRCSYRGEFGALRYENNIQAYQKTLLFMLTFRKED